MKRDQQFLWYTHFLVEPDDRTDGDIFWTDEVAVTRGVRKPTQQEKRSIVLVGVAAIGLLVALVVTLIVAVYVSRH